MSPEIVQNHPIRNLLILLLSQEIARGPANGDAPVIGRHNAFPENAMHLRSVAEALEIVIADVLHAPPKGVPWTADAGPVVPEIGPAASVNQAIGDHVQIHHPVATITQNLLLHVDQWIGDLKPNRRKPARNRLIQKLEIIHHPRVRQSPA